LREKGFHIKDINMFKRLIGLFSGVPKRPERRLKTIGEGTVYDDERYNVSWQLVALEGPNRAGELLKQSTAYNKTGNVDVAIAAIRQPIRVAAPDYLTVQDYLRIPLYLQSARRFDEAWSEINDLLGSFRHSTERMNHDVLPFDHSTIYDKMRLILHREGEDARAVGYGILSFLSEAIGLRRQRRGAELDGMRDDASIQEAVAVLLKKAKRPELLVALTRLVKSLAQGAPEDRPTVR
jgi:hypothetical protein